ncbi:prepilin-type N-terminal cleavage/methylation domain-containing protein [Myxococcus sp. SDU36]|uniref:PilW family protein n=1 Tax=Myxococcus sp. SDU36 TaxID=2831967 RepID=UPI002543E41A|nr:prepilin-type N-terminal cleavage/methylation domain-containing protein [Myxococcus sp. SDU36]WIG94432.1 prepilin-type N-terminal cleavage/methylation domain-containing protein [Myxococcus sp. SDU36]
MSPRIRGFTLLEVMIASAIGLIVLGAGLVAAMQMQRRALFEEQTMQAQVAGRTLAELITSDLQRAGTGMGNAPIIFSDTRVQTAVQVWTEPDLRVADATRPFPTDLGFALPPPGILENERSDVLQIHWGNPRALVNLTTVGCAGPGVRNGMQGFCLVPNSSNRLQPVGGATSTPAFVVNPNQLLACHVRVTNVDPANNLLTAEPGIGDERTTSGPCFDPGAGPWSINSEQETWRIMQAQSATYRVNWASGTPILEYLGPGAVDWVALSRDVERLKVRLGVVAIAAPFGGMRWFPDEENGQPLALDECERTTCPIEVHPSESVAPASDEELRLRLGQRIREVEVTLVVRTPRQNREAFDPTQPIIRDREGFPVDGFKRRTFTFRVSLRNFAAGGLLPVPVGP